ncbi:hypothetical protein [Tindallia californiensis]|uniref:Uncharacterized protein n=1 Tax=Tindallia californiensis TaxID=159292 RepID=A0A1H3K934_9FIRM|nr:hypothetical protein [Tindallia californiensis]SDY48054.1 hypothetical protein SAMN05192546_102253 [Tindallia californiensis]
MNYSNVSYQNQSQSFSKQSLKGSPAEEKNTKNSYHSYQSIIDSNFSTMNYFGTGSIKSNW